MIAWVLSCYWSWQEYFPRFTAWLKWCMGCGKKLWHSYQRRPQNIQHFVSRYCVGNAIIIGKMDHLMLSCFRKLRNAFRLCREMWQTVNSFGPLSFFAVGGAFCLFGLFTMVFTQGSHPSLIDLWHKLLFAFNHGINTVCQIFEECFEFSPTLNVSCSLINRHLPRETGDLTKLARLSWTTAHC